MSLEEWRHGLHTGLEQNFFPALRRRNEDWHIVCQKIIDHCVAPEMRPMALEMLHGAMMAAQRDSANDEDIPRAPANTPVIPPLQPGN